MIYLFNPMQGEIKRTKWWLSQVAAYGVMLLLAIFLVVTNFDTSMPNGTGYTPTTGHIYIVAAFLVYMNMCTCLNRLRDSGRSGWWYLAFMLPLIGLLAMIYFCGIEE